MGAKSSLHSERLMFCLQCSKPIIQNSICEKCWALLKQTKHKSNREVESFPVYTFWSWPMNHQLKALWLQKLKGNEQSSAWLDIAQLMIEPYSPQGSPWDQGTLWIPLPTSRRQNHAYGLSQALVKVFGGVLWDGLRLAEEPKNSDLEQQKNKNRRQRLDRQIILLGRLPCSSFKAVCLVDDIITTGSTFKAGFAALGYPENGLGLAVMDRPLSH